MNEQDILYDEYEQVIPCVVCSQPATGMHESIATGNMFPRCDVHLSASIEQDRDVRQTMLFEGGSYE